MGYTAHLWVAFVSLTVTVSLCRLHRASYISMFTHIHASRSIKAAFQGVTLSFDMSCIQFSDSNQMYSIKFDSWPLFSSNNVSHLILDLLCTWILHVLHIVMPYSLQMLWTSYYPGFHILQDSDSTLNRLEGLYILWFQDPSQK